MFHSVCARLHLHRWRVPKATRRYPTHEYCIKGLSGNPTQSISGLGEGYFGTGTIYSRIDRLPFSVLSFTLNFMKMFQVEMLYDPELIQTVKDCLVILNIARAEDCLVTLSVAPIEDCLVMLNPVPIKECLEVNFNGYYSRDSTSCNIAFVRLRVEDTV